MRFYDREQEIKTLRDICRIVIDEFQDFLRVNKSIFLRHAAYLGTSERRKSYACFLSAYGWSGGVCRTVDGQRVFYVEEDDQSCAESRFSILSLIARGHTTRIDMDREL